MADQGNDRVLMYPPANLVTGGNANLELGQPAATAFTSSTLNGPVEPSTLVQPIGIAFDSSGRIFATDAANRTPVFAPPFTNGMKKPTS